MRATSFLLAMFGGEMRIITYNPHRDAEEPGPDIEPKPREEVLLGECGPEGVDVCQCV